MGNTNGTANGNSKPTTTKNQRQRGFETGDKNIADLKQAIEDDDYARMLKVISRNDYDIIQCNFFGESALSLAIRGNKVNLVLVFLLMGAAGSHKHVRDSFDQDPCSLLELAEKIPNYEIIKLLLIYAAVSPNDVKKQETFQNIPQQIETNQIKKLEKSLQIETFKREYGNVHQPIFKILDATKPTRQTLIDIIFYLCIKTILNDEKIFNKHQTPQQNLLAAITHKNKLMELALRTIMDEANTNPDKTMTLENLTLYLACYVARHLNKPTCLETLLGENSLIEKFDFNSQIPGEEDGIDPFWVICFTAGMLRKFDLGILINNNTSKDILDKLNYKTAPTTGDFQNYSSLHLITHNRNSSQILFSCYTPKQLASFDWNKIEKNGLSPLWNLVHYSYDGTTHLIHMLSTFPYDAINKLKLDVKPFVKQGNFSRSINGLLKQKYLFSTCQYIIEVRKTIQLHSELETANNDKRRFEIENQIASSCKKVSELIPEMEHESNSDHIREISIEFVLCIYKKSNKDALNGAEVENKDYEKITWDAAVNIHRNYTAGPNEITKERYLHTFIKEGYLLNAKRSISDVLKGKTDAATTITDKIIYRCVTTIIKNNDIFDLSDSPLENYAAASGYNHRLMLITLPPLTSVGFKYDIARSYEKTRENVALYLACYVATHHKDNNPLEELLKNGPLEKFDLDSQISGADDGISPLSVIANSQSLLQLLFTRYTTEQLNQFNWNQRTPSKSILALLFTVKNAIEKISSNFDYQHIHMTKLTKEKDFFQNLLAQAKTLVSMHQELLENKKHQPLASQENQTPNNPQQHDQEQLLNQKYIELNTITQSLLKTFETLKEKTNQTLEELQLENEKLKKENEELKQKQAKIQNKGSEIGGNQDMFFKTIPTLSRRASCSDITSANKFKL